MFKSVDFAKSVAKIICINNKLFGFVFYLMFINYDLTKTLRILGFLCNKIKSYDINFCLNKAKSRETPLNTDVSRFLNFP